MHLWFLHVFETFLGFLFCFVLFSHAGPMKPAKLLFLVKVIVGQL